MGTVHLAVHDASGLQVAIKTSHASSPAAAARFRREIHALSRIDHPNIVRIVEQGVDGWSTWYAMAYLEGPTLTDYIEDIHRVPFAFEEGSGDTMDPQTADGGANRTGVLDATADGQGLADAGTSAPDLETADAHGATAAPAFESGDTADAVVSPHLADTFNAADMDSQVGGATILGLTDLEADYEVHVTGDLERSTRPPGAGPQLAAGGRLADAMRIVHALCCALSDLHGQGIIHRDLKPSNIVIVDGEPILVDFGLVAHIGATVGRENLDREHSLSGTLAYMAPEQINQALLDMRCDLYALGCIIYQILTGQPPFLGPPTKVMYQHHFRQAPPPSELVAGVPHELDDLVARLLAKAPSERIGYASDVAAALRSMGLVGEEVGRPTGRPYLYRPSLAGRADELKKVDEILGHLRTGIGSLLLIDGESGVGKTRLANEVAVRLRERVTTVTTECPSGATARTAPLKPILPLLRTIADRCREKGAEETQHLLGDDGPVLAMWEPDMLDVPGADDWDELVPLSLSAERKRLFQALRDVTFRFAQQRTLLLMIDDLQWADELTLGFLASVADEVYQHPLLVVGTFRSEELTDRLTSLYEHDSVTRMSLGRLDRGAVGQMVGDMLAMPTPAMPFVEFLFEQSEGNPFFVAEYLRGAVAEGVLWRDEAGKWTLKGGADLQDATRSLDLPQTLVELIDVRLRALSFEARTILEAAAVIGREFDVEVAEEAAGYTGREGLDAVDELRVRRVVQPIDGGRYTFEHDKLREITYERIPAARRRATHATVAITIERYYAEEGIGPHRAAVGEHWVQAGDAKRAVPHLCAAGDALVAAYANEVALALYTSALGQLERIEPGDVDAEGVDSFERARIVEEAIGDTLARLGRQEPAREAFERAKASPVAFDSIRGRLARKIGKTHEVLHQHDRALAAYREAEQLFSEGREPTSGDDLSDEQRREWLQLHIDMSWCFYWLGKTEEMSRVTDLIGPMVAAHATGVQKARFYQTLVNRNYRRDRYAVVDETLEYAHASMAAADETGSLPDRILAGFILGFALLFAGRAKDAITTLKTALERAENTGDLPMQIRCLAYLTTAYRSVGDVQRTAIFARRTSDAAETAGMKDYVGAATANLAWVALRDGKFDETVELANRALDIFAELSLVYPLQWHALFPLAASRAQAGDIDGAMDAFARMLEPAQQKLAEPLTAAMEAVVSAHATGFVGAQDLRESLALARAQGYV